MRIEISREDVLLDTGGGLKKVAWFFLQDGATTSRSFCTMSTFSAQSTCTAWSNFTKKQHALATLAVQDRPTARYLSVRSEAQLCGRRAGADGKPELVRTASQFEALAFSGIHVISPHLLPMLSEDGAFSIIASYLRLAGAGENICALRADEYAWRDMGKLENIAKAAEDLKTYLQ